MVHNCCCYHMDLNCFQVHCCPSNYSDYYCWNLSHCYCPLVLDLKPMDWWNCYDHDRAYHRRHRHHHHFYYHRRHRRLRFRRRRHHLKYKFSFIRNSIRNRIVYVHLPKIPELKLRLLSRRLKLRLLSRRLLLLLLRPNKKNKSKTILISEWSHTIRCDYKISIPRLPPEFELFRLPPFPPFSPPKPPYLSAM